MKFRITISVLAAMMVPVCVPTAQAATKSDCATITLCRELANRQHTIVVHNNVNIARALGVTAHPKDVPVCHTLLMCQLVAGAQVHTRIYTQGVWWHITTDQSVLGAKRAITYWFRSTAPVALEIATCESQLHWYSWNGLDDGIFQYELFAHPDIHIFTPAEQAKMKVPLRSQASIVWWATQRAFRDSDGGTHWSPMWTCAVIHHIA